MRRRLRTAILVDRLPGGQQGLDDLVQRSLGDQRSHPVYKGLAAALASDQAEWLEDAPDLVGEVDPHAHQLGAGGEQRADQLAVETLDRHLPIPARTDDLRQPPSVVTVGLVQLQRQRRLGVPRIQADDRQTGSL